MFLAVWAAEVVFCEGHIVFQAEREDMATAVAAMFGSNDIAKHIAKRDDRNHSNGHPCGRQNEKRRGTEEKKEAAKQFFRHRHRAQTSLGIGVSRLVANG